ncbi:immune inhibitor A [bacterium]|nr:immune inhibitor A [bacterium]
MKPAFLAGLTCLLVTIAVAAGHGNITDLNKTTLNHAEQAWHEGVATPQQLDLLAAAGFDAGQANQPMIDDLGGPDLSGHVWVDSNEPDGPDYGWIDITAVGTQIDSLMTDDCELGPFDLGFDFPLYDNFYSQVYVASNGGLIFADYYFYYYNQPLPYNHGQPDNSSIFWFWDDWYVVNGANGDVYYAQATLGDRDAWILSYIDVEHIAMGTVTAQVVLFDDGEILIQYEEISDDYSTNSCTVGIQNDDLSDYLQVVYNSLYLEDELAVSIYLADADATLAGTVTDSLSGDPLADAFVQLGLWSTTTNMDGDYQFDALYSGFTYDVTVEALNHYDLETTINLEPGDNTFDIELMPFPTPFNGSYATDFEIGEGPFSAGDYDDWQFGEPTFWPVGAHSGENAWSTILAGSYNNSRDDWLLVTETFLIENDSAFLSYWHWYNYEAGADGYNVQVSLDGMQTWDVLEPEMGYSDPGGIPANGYQPCFNNSGAGSGVWQEVTFDLSAYVGQQIWLAFRHTTDDDFNVYSGVTIDDLEINVGRPPSGVTLELTGTSTTVPPSGGSIYFDATVHSALPNTVLVDAWSAVTLPGGTMYGPLVNVPLYLNPGTTTFTDLPQSVPAMAPGGVYTYHAWVGQFPNVIGATDTFQFFKAGNDPNGGGSWSDQTMASVLNKQSAQDVTNVELPSAYALGQAYPNPFNPSTSVTLSLPEAAEVKVTAFNVMGQSVATLGSGRMNAGVHTLTFDAQELASGVYFIRAEIPGQLNELRKVMLVR